MAKKKMDFHIYVIMPMSKHTHEQPALNQQTQLNQQAQNGAKRRQGGGETTQLNN